jgi:hypothetical protein
MMRMKSSDIAVDPHFGFRFSVFGFRTVAPKTEN